MLFLLQRLSRHPTRARANFRIYPSTAAYRSISTTPTKWSTSAPEPPTPEEEAELEAANPELDLEDTEALSEAEEGNESRSQTPESYNEFMSGIGLRYKFAKPNNWLGGDVPFPMNASFKPPPPLSDLMRQQIYNEYMANPVKNSVRISSQRYHLSIKRVDAILRLKGLEHSWYKGKQIQYGFQRGMEKLLGVKSYKVTQPLRDGPRWEAIEADSLEQDENRDAQRQRYQRHYWEAVPEDGREPIVPTALEHAKSLAQRFEGRRKPASSQLMPKFSDSGHIMTPLEHQNLEKRGSPILEIRDVGDKFLNLNGGLKRIATVKRRRVERGGKRARGTKQSL